MSDTSHPHPDTLFRPPAGYLDAVGGQPSADPVHTSMTAALERAWSDPARLHHPGRTAGAILDASRASLAGYLGVRPADVYLAGSAAEGLAMVIGGVTRARLAAGCRPRIVHTAVESFAVMGACAAITGAEVIVVDVTATGAVDPATLESALTADTALACVQAANAEIGTRQPLAAIHALCQERGVPLVVDAAQVIGHDPVPTAWDVLVCAGRDWGGVPGAAVVAVRPGVRWDPPLAPDRGWLGGFPNIPAAAACGSALELLAPHVESMARDHRDLIAKLRDALPERIPGLVVLGDPDDRLPHIVTMVLESGVGEEVVIALGKRGISIASGSACTADAARASHVVEALGYRGLASIRVSLPFGCTAQTIDDFADALCEVVSPD